MSTSQKNLQKLSLSSFDIWLDENFDFYFLWTKIILIVMTLFWAILFIIQWGLQRHINKVQTEQGNTPNTATQYLEKIQNILSKMNDVFFYSILVFVFIICALLMYITRSSWYDIVQHSSKTLRKIKVEKRQVQVSGYFLSLNWWMMAYFLVLLLLVLIAKITNDTSKLYSFV